MTEIYLHFICTHYGFSGNAPVYTGGGGVDVCGRPADVLVAPDGSVLISDEMSGVLIRASPAGL